MNVSCPECRSVFRVDPAKVPVGGVRARCSVCGGIILVGVERIEMQRPAGDAARIAAQNKGRRKQQSGAFDRPKSSRLHICRVAAVEIIKWPAVWLRQLHISRAVVGIGICNLGMDLLHPTRLLGPGISRAPRDIATGHRIQFGIIIGEHFHPQPNLVQIRNATGRPRLLFCLAQRRQ